MVLEVTVLGTLVLVMVDEDEGEGGEDDGVGAEGVDVLRTVEAGWNAKVSAVLFPAAEDRRRYTTLHSPQ